jgi:hypothetical protein
MGAKFFNKGALRYQNKVTEIKKFEKTTFPIRIRFSTKVWISKEVIFYECTSCQLPISSHYFWVG